MIQRRSNQRKNFLSFATSPKFLLVKWNTPVFPFFQRSPGLFVYRPLGFSFVLPPLLLPLPISLSLSLFLPLFFLYQALIACTNAFHEARISRQSRFLTGAPGERSTLSGQRGCRVNILQKIDLSLSISSKRWRLGRRGEDMSRKIRETSPSLVEGFCNFNRPIALHEALSLSIPKDTFCNTLPFLLLLSPV